LYFERLEESEQVELVEFLNRTWDRFEQTFISSLRNPAYRGLVNNLLLEQSDEWAYLKIVQWRIVPRPQEEEKPRTPRQYRLEILKLKTLPWGVGFARNR